jgi:hypothetical protein
MRWRGTRAERKDWARDVLWRGPTMQRGEVHLRLCKTVQDHAPRAMWGNGVSWAMGESGRLAVFNSRWAMSRGRVCRIW